MEEWDEDEKEDSFEQMEEQNKDQSKENEEKSDKDKDSQTIPIPQDLTNKIPGVNPVPEPQKKPSGPDLPFPISWDNNKPINPKKV